MLRRVSLLLSLLVLIPSVTLAGLETDGVTVYNLATGGQTVFQASAGAGVSVYIKASGFNSVGDVINDRDLNWSAGVTLPRLSGVTAAVQTQINDLTGAVSAFVIDTTALITTHTNAGAFTGDTDFAVDSQVSAFVVLQNQAVHGQVSSYVQSQVSQYPYASQVSSWFTSGTSKFLSGNTADPHSVLALYTSYEQLHGVSGYALDSQVSAFVIGQGYAVASQTSAYVQSQVSQYPYASQVSSWFQAGVSQYPYDASVSAWIIDASQSVHSQATSYVLAQITGVSNALITGVSIIWTSIPGSGTSGFTLKYAAGGTVYWAPDNDSGGGSGHTHTVVAYQASPTAESLRNALITLGFMQAAPPPSPFRFEDRNLYWENRGTIYEDRNI